MADAVARIGCWVVERRQTYVITCPVYTVMVSTQQPAHRRILNRAGMVTPDGMPLVFLSRWKGHPEVGRVYGPDLMLAVCQQAAQHGWRMYFYGGAEGVPGELAEVMRARFPGLQVAGAYSPPFRDLTPQEEADIAARINAAQPDVVWVGLGSPKQDYWCAHWRDKLDAPVLIGVGAAFDFHTGRVAQAPRWMQRSALEWLFRLLTEPRRLWRRYVIYNPWFVTLVLLQTLGLKRWPITEEPHITG